MRHVEGHDARRFASAISAGRHSMVRRGFIATRWRAVDESLMRRLAID